MYILLRALQPGLFDATVPVKGHSTKKGTYVNPYQAKRKKRLDDPSADLFAEPAKPAPAPAPVKEPEPVKPAPDRKVFESKNYRTTVQFVDQGLIGKFWRVDHSYKTLGGWWEADGPSKTYMKEKSALAAAQRYMDKHKPKDPPAPEPAPPSNAPLVGYRKESSPATGSIHAGTFYAINPKTWEQAGVKMIRHEFHFPEGKVLNLPQEEVEAFEGLPSEALAHQWFPDFNWSQTAKTMGIEDGMLMDQMVAHEAHRRGYQAIRYGDLELQVLDNLKGTPEPAPKPSPENTAEARIKADPDLRDWFTGYASSSYSMINGSLRNPDYFKENDYISEEVQQDIQQAIQQMRKGFALAPERKITGKWRGGGPWIVVPLLEKIGIQIKNTEQFEAIPQETLDKLKGQQFLDRGFVSTSSLKSVARRFIHEMPHDSEGIGYVDCLIRFEGTAPALTMNDILHFRSDENEVLLKDGLTFEVTDAQWETSDESRFESQSLILTVRVVPSRKP